MTAAIAHAQSALVRGHITDSSGAAVNTAAVEIQNMGTGLRWNSMTNTSGYYQFPPLEPGVYTLKITSSGFAPATVTNITLEVGGSAAEDLVLQPASASKTVVVTAGAPELEFDHPDRGNVIESEFLQSMPLNIRNPCKWSTSHRKSLPTISTPATTTKARHTQTPSASTVQRSR